MEIFYAKRISCQFWQTPPRVPQLSPCASGECGVKWHTLKSWDRKSGYDCFSFLRAALYQGDGFIKRFICRAAINRRNRPPRGLYPRPRAQNYLFCGALKIIYFAGEIAAHAVAEEMRLPHNNIVENVLSFLVKEEFCQITGAQGYSERAYRYTVTTKGSNKAQELLARNQYAGPAPVPLMTYIETVHQQAIGSISVQQGTIRDAFG
ncbi:MAG: hypothetical protein DCC52_03805, partial [Chloroflexi bacterium]